MTSTLAVVSLALCVGCGQQRSSEEKFVAKEIVELRAAVAAHDQVKITTGCILATTGLSHMPPDMTKEIEQLCYDDAPRVLLEGAIAEAKKDQASSLAQLDHKLTCFQLFAEDALKYAAKRPTPTPAVAALVTEYEHLCPEKVAEYRARAATSSGSRSTP